MDTSIFLITSFLVALFIALFTVLSYLMKPTSIEKRKKLLKKVIYLSIIVTLIIYILSIALPHLLPDNEFNRTFESNDSLSSANKIENTKIQIPDSSFYEHLSSDQIRKEISEYLKSEDIDKAISLLNFLQSDEIIDEECSHIFNYCIKNERLEKAKKVIDFFRSPKKTEEANKRLSLELVKIK